MRDHCSMAALIGFQSFRLLPETLLALAYHEGLVPIQMTVEGRNWDILSAALGGHFVVLRKLHRRTAG